MEYYVEKKVYLSNELCETIDELAHCAYDSFRGNTDDYRHDGFSFDIVLPLSKISKQEHQGLIDIFKNIGKKTDEYETYALFVDDYDFMLENSERLGDKCVCVIVIRIYNDMNNKQIKEFKHHVKHNIINRLFHFINSLNCYSNDK